RGAAFALPTPAMSRRGVCGAAVLLMWSAVACESTVPTPVRVLPPDGGTARLTSRAAVVASRASLTEDLPSGVEQPERIIVGITIANLGDGPVENVFVHEGRVDWLGTG